MSSFELHSKFSPTGDQPEAIDAIVRQFEEGQNHQVLLGVTGSGKTFTVANVIAKMGKPTLVIAHNKTLAAQLYNEFKGFFPNNAVEYFVSYYDYYQPEAYVPTTDTFIEKDASINDELDCLRHAATRSALMREDVIVVASVSSIYGLGSPADYFDLHIDISVGMEMDREELLTQLVRIQYRRSDAALRRASFRARGDVVEIIPAHEEEQAIRVEFFGEEIDSHHRDRAVAGNRFKKTRPGGDLSQQPLHHARGEALDRHRGHPEGVVGARGGVERARRSPYEAQRLQQRTLQDIEMLREVGYCHGVENYSLHLDGRLTGEPPATLFSYFSRDHLVVIDESHQSIPQLQGHVPGRPLAQGNPGGLRLPASIGPGQPPARDERVRVEPQEHDLRFGDSRPLRTGEERRASSWSSC